MKKSIELTLGDFRPNTSHQGADVDTSKLYELKAKGRKFAEKKYKRLEMQDGIVNMESYQADFKNDSCDSFSFCRKFDLLMECHLGATNRQNLPPDWKEDGGEYFESDAECDLYSISSLRHFQEHPNSKLIAECK